jgi:Tfp pilus assembly protein PilV
MRNSLFTALNDETGFGLVEAMIAMTILVIGLLAVSGLTLATAAQARIADLRNDQMIAGQSRIEEMRNQDFDTLGSGVDTVSSNYQTYYVTSTVVDLNARAKQVTVSIAPATAGLTARSFDAVLHKPRSLPAGP